VELAFLLLAEFRLPGISIRFAAAFAYVPTNVRGICERYLAGNYELDVVDVYQQAEITKAADVITLPTLVKELPFPTKKFVGDMPDIVSCPSTSPGK
jgi:hypothetical protein